MQWRCSLCLHHALWASPCVHSNLTPAHPTWSTKADDDSDSAAPITRASSMDRLFTCETGGIPTGTCTYTCQARDQQSGTTVW